MQQINTQKYFELLPIANNIYEKLYGKPKTHTEWANQFNIKGDIIRELYNKLPIKEIHEFG